MKWTNALMPDVDAPPSDEQFDDELEPAETLIESREARQEQYLLIGILVLAAIAVVAVGWRLFADSGETEAGYIDPLTQLCAVDEETLIALGGEPSPNDKFWDGLHLIGSNSILPGTYQNTGSGSCYWARLSGTTGAEQEIVASNQSTGGPQTVTILESDAAFTSMGCGEWHAVAE